MLAVSRSTFSQNVKLSPYCIIRDNGKIRLSRRAARYRAAMDPTQVRGSGAGGSQDICPCGGQPQCAANRYEAYLNPG